MKLFSKATIKLTLWYLAVLMTVSLAFSTTIYKLSSYELERPLPLNNQPTLQYIYGPDGVDQAREARAVEGRHHLLLNLLILNLVTLGLGSAASYLFARRTLQPIENVMEAQIRFTSDASHELNTPLAVIQAENEVALRNKRLSTAESRELIKSNLEEVARLQLLTHRLLALSNDDDVELGLVSIEDACIDATNRQIALAQAQNIVIENKAANIKARSNTASLADILSILLENAIKYSSAGSVVRLDTVKDGRTVFVRVTDQGPGIDVDDVPYIFDRFYRADMSRTKAKFNGYGLGLALAQRLAVQCEAKVELAATSKKGSTFSVRLSAA